MNRYRTIEQIDEEIRERASKLEVAIGFLVKAFLLITALLIIQLTLQL